jgi:hypothetical protein
VLLVLVFFLLVMSPETFLLLLRSYEYCYAVFRPLCDCTPCVKVRTSMVRALLLFGALITGVSTTVALLVPDQTARQSAM